MKQCPLDTNKLKVEKTDLGFIIEFPNDNGGEFPRKVVVSHDILNGEMFGILNALWTIHWWLEHGQSSRYSRERIIIRLVHGDKYKCTDKKCKICKGAK